MKKTAPKTKEKKAKKERLVLLDSHAILHRAYHALPDFTSQTGEPTGALYGLCLMLLKIAQELKPDYLIACFDLPDPTHRHTAYANYKAGRAKTDDALSAQISRSKEVFSAFSIPLYEKAGFEADDLLGTIAAKTKTHKNLEVVIASGDMDTLQLVEDKRVTVYTLKKGIQDTIIYDEDAVKERFNFGPELLPDYKGLRGDPSDNIIGVPGIGEKTATDLIVNFGSLEKIFKALKKNEETLIEAGIKKRIVELLKEHEEEALFSKALATIHRDVPIAFSLPEKHWRDSLDWPHVHALFKQLGFKSLIQRTQASLGFDEETSDETEATTDTPVDPKEEAETAVALWVLDSERTNPKLESILEYADTRDFQKAKAKIFEDLKKEGLESVFENIEKPLMEVVAKMEKHGVCVDRKYLETLSEDYRARLAEIEARIYEAAGETFNINSPRQLGTIIYDKLGLTSGRIKKTETGAKSTKESELQKLAHLHPIIEDILAYREIQKLLSTYIDAIPSLMDEDGRLRARFIQAGSTTGRMASEHPNLQNIPIRTELGQPIRRAFVAPPGFCLAGLDYSQVELRIAAILAEEPKLIEVFKSGEDIHTSVAAEVFNVAREKVDKEMRRKAKIINFGILYGMGVNALRENLGGTREEAQEFLDAYFIKFPALAGYLEKTKREAAKYGYTTTLFGRRRRFPDIKSKIPYLKAAAERMAVNAPIQGTQADLIKIAMVRINAWLTEEGKQEDVHCILQVHDELVFEVKEAEAHTLIAAIKNIMESVLTPIEAKGVPIIAGAALGKNWGEMEKINL